MMLKIIAIDNKEDLQLKGDIEALAATALDHPEIISYKTKEFIEKNPGQIFEAMEAITKIAVDKNNLVLPLSVMKWVAEYAPKKIDIALGAILKTEGLSYEDKTTLVKGAIQMLSKVIGISAEMFSVIKVIFNEDSTCYLKSGRKEDPNKVRMDSWLNTAMSTLRTENLYYWGECRQLLAEYLKQCRENQSEKPATKTTPKPENPIINPTKGQGSKANGSTGSPPVNSPAHREKELPSKPSNHTGKVPGTAEYHEAEASYCKTMANTWFSLGGDMGNEFLKRSKEHALSMACITVAKQDDPDKKYIEIQGKNTVTDFLSCVKSFLGKLEKKLELEKETPYKPYRQLTNPEKLEFFNAVTSTLKGSPIYSNIIGSPAWKEYFLELEGASSPKTTI